MNKTMVAKIIFGSEPEGTTEMGKAQTETDGRCRE
jgi:hypothetical protein